jgi:CheY-like chemotaxis protein
MSSTKQEKGPVLVVDDDPDIRAGLRDTLEQEGYAVREARDGSEALGWLRANPPPPLVLLDWNMAPMSGPKFMEALAAEPFAQLPVVLLTADARIEEKAKTAPYVGHLKKPVKLDDLFALVRAHCG